MSSMRAYIDLVAKPLAGFTRPRLLLEALSPIEARELFLSHGATSKDLSSAKALHAARNRLMKRMHSDVAGGGDAATKEINAAYDTLKQTFSSARGKAKPGKMKTSGLTMNAFFNDPPAEVEEMRVVRDWNPADPTVRNLVLDIVWQTYRSIRINTGHAKKILALRPGATLQDTDPSASNADSHPPKWFSVTNHGAYYIFKLTHAAGRRGPNPGPDGLEWSVQPDTTDYKVDADHLKAGLTELIAKARAQTPAQIK